MEICNNYLNEDSFLKIAHKYVDVFKNSEVALWGKGKQINVLLKYCKDLNIKYIIDKNAALSGKTKICNKEFDVFSPQKLLQDKDKGIKIIVMLAGSDYEDISEELFKMGFNNNDFCCAYDYVVAYNIINNNKLVVPNLELIVTTVCTLKCKNCIAKIPYFDKSKIFHRPFEKLKTEIDNIFNKFDYIGRFQLATGEVLLHPELPKIIEYVALNYKDKYDHFTFVTNGTIVPNDEKLSYISKYIDFIQISPYFNEELKGLLKADKLIEKFKKYQISYLYGHYATGRELPKWNDIGDMVTNQNRSNEENIRIYQKCLMNVCKCISDNLIYPCTAACYSALKGDNCQDTNINNRDFVSVNSTKMDIARYYLKSSNCDFPLICDRCLGIGPTINKILVPAAEQIK